MKRRLPALVGGVVVVGVVVGIVAVAQGGDGDSDGGGEATGGSYETAPVERLTLTQTTEVTGTLDHGETHSLAAGRDGTLTSAAADGSTVGRGQTLFTVDRHPVVLLVGSVPLYRDLTAGVDDGPDVAQLEQNLSDLGHTDGGALTVDEHFDDATTDAVEAWQEALGVEATGTVTRGDAVFLPGPVRISDTAVDLGAVVSASTGVVTYASAGHVVRVQLEAAQADLAQVDDTVTVTLPDGSEAAGTVTSVAEGATSDSGSSDTSSGSTPAGGATATTTPTATVEVTIGLDDPAAVAGYVTASVDVRFTSTERTDVLAVPVTALVALLEGGYAVEVVGEGGATELVAVDVGMFADTSVEVSGDGIEEGTEVVVPG